jgi:hypothetical protein
MTLKTMMRRMPMFLPDSWRLRRREFGYIL